MYAVISFPAKLQFEGICLNCNDEECMMPSNALTHNWTIQ
jgi:hypothetical protein